MKIRFERCIRATKRGATPRRIVAARAGIKRAIDKAGLFADEWVTERDPIERIERFDQQFVDMWKHMRDLRASQWRKGRALLRSLPITLQHDLLEKWNSGPYPGDPAMLCSCLAMWLARLNEDAEAVQARLYKQAAELDARKQARP